MNDSRRSLAGLSDDELGVQLRSLAGWVASPVPATAPGTLDPARQARLRIERGEGRSWLHPVRRHAFAEPAECPR
jgi:hypothetical protein